jgi:integrase
MTLGGYVSLRRLRALITKEVIQMRRDRLWECLISGNDPLGEAGALAHLRETSRKGLIKCYGRWLEWLYRTEPGVLALPPVSRATVERLRAWIAQLAQVAPPTRLTLVNGALQVLREAYPENDWRRPLRLLEPLRIEVRNWESPRKRGRVISSSVVLAAAIELCGTKAAAASAPFYGALMRRDGTMIAFLAMVPIRLRALSELTLGKSVLVSATQIKVSLSEDMTKNGLPWEALVPPLLDGLMRAYLGETRVWLMKRTGARHDSLWVTSMGGPLAYGQIKNRIPDVTGRELGIKVSPHLFRDMAVTTLVRSSPEDARLTRPLLAHASYGIVERHYNGATGIEAGRDYAAVIEGLRRKD